MYMLRKQSKKNLLWMSFFLLVGTVYIFIYSCSNTCLIVSVLFIILNIYLQLRTRLAKIEKAIIQLIYPACLLFSIAGPLITSGRLFELLDRVLHNRWVYSLYYLTNEPITLFGVRFKEAPNTNYMFDSSFLYSFLQIGVIPFLILTLFYLGMIHDYVKQEKKMELAIIISFCVLGLVLYTNRAAVPDKQAVSCIAPCVVNCSVNVFTGQHVQLFRVYASFGNVVSGNNAVNV